MNFTNPQTVLHELGVKETDVVVDVGSGSGHYSIAAAKMVPSGHVYAVDVQKELMLNLKEQARSQALVNLDVVWGNGEKLNGTTLDAGVANVVIVSNTLFQAEDKKTMLQEAHRLLKPAGTLLVIDWSDSYGGIGPSPEHILPKGDAIKLVEEAGFIVKEELEPGEHHYGIIATKKGDA